MVGVEEQGCIQQLIAHAAIDALGVAILHRCAPSDVMPLQPDLTASRENGVAGEFGAIVADDDAVLVPRR